jgi:hypothetical protein
MYKSESLIKLAFESSMKILASLSFSLLLLRAENWAMSSAFSLLRRCASLEINKIGVPAFTKSPFETNLCPIFPLIVTKASY